MKKKLSTFAILVGLSASLAFAGDKAKSAASSDDAQPAATAAASDSSTASEQNPCVTTKQNKKAKNHNKPAETDQEKEFDRVLMGIYG